MHPQDITPATVERHMRHARTIRAEAFLSVLSRVPAALKRAAHTVTAMIA